MSIKTRKMIALCVVSTLLPTLVGCSSSSKDTSNNVKTETTNKETSTAEIKGETKKETSTATTEGVTYPLQNAPKLTYWVDLNSNVSAGAKSLNDTEFAKALIEETGVKVEFIHPAQGQAKEKFNLLIASGDMPDIVEGPWNDWYPGGPELAMQQKLMYQLNDQLEGWAPDFNKFLQDNPNVAKMAKTDSGKFFGFPFIRGDDLLMVFYGPMLRQDWLDELGLTVPETIDEWETVLTAFKEKKGATAPFAGEATADSPLTPFNTGLFIGAYGTSTGFYIGEDSKTVEYGPITSGYKEWLIKMTDWYSKGLLNKNFVTDTRKELDANLMNDKTGATIGYTGSGMGRWLAAFEQAGSDAELVAAKYPVLNKGETPKFTQKDTPIIKGSVIAAVNPRGKNVETAMKFLNFGYTEAGNMLYNFGVEGDSYTMVEGYPTMADKILKPEEGSSVSQEWGQYARSVYNGPFVQRKEYIQQYLQLPEQVAALDAWAVTDVDKRSIPPITPTVDESKEYNRIINEMNTFIAEWVPGVIIGKNSINDFESVFIKTLKDIGVERALEIQQGAFDRYQQR